MIPRAPEQKLGVVVGKKPQCWGLETGFLITTVASLSFRTVRGWSQRRRTPAIFFQLPHMCTTYTHTHTYFKHSCCYFFLFLPSPYILPFLLSSIGLPHFLHFVTQISSYPLSRVSPPLCSQSPSVFLVFWGYFTLHLGCLTQCNTF